jgi:hypothetical protein
MLCPLPPLIPVSNRSAVAFVGLVHECLARDQRHQHTPHNKSSVLERLPFTSPLTRACDEVVMVMVMVMIRGDLLGSRYLLSRVSYSRTLRDSRHTPLLPIHVPSHDTETPQKFTPP